MTPVEVRDALDAAMRLLVGVREDVAGLLGDDQGQALFAAAVVVDGVRARIDHAIGTGEVGS